MSFSPGLELTGHFYNDVVQPIVSAAMGSVPFSAGLIGWGSEVQGFDTPRSMDHAWGPRMQVFLRPDTYVELSAELDAALEELLPETFEGHRVRFAFPDGATPRHWVLPVNVEQYFADYLGVSISEGVSARTWLMAPTQSLRELTGGTVVHDGLGLLIPWRESLAWYPDDVWRYVLASQWMRLDAEEPFVGRCGEVGDDLGSAVVASRLVRDLMRLALLLSRVYPPYSKWLGSAFRQTSLSGELAPHLTAVLRAGDWQERQDSLIPAFELLADRQNRLGLAESVDPTVRPFHTRPFLVLDSHRFADALVAAMTDRSLAALPLVGAIDQYVDSTALLDRTAAQDRRAYVSGPRIT